MCAKKKANFAFWLTIWPRFERRKIFLETVLQILLICVCHFSCSSTVTPSRRCFETCSTGVVSSCCFWCFCLVAINMFWLDSVPSDFYNTTQRYHLDVRILSMLSLAVLRVPSSANKSHGTDGRVRHIGRSLIKIRNKRGPSIDP